MLGCRNQLVQSYDIFFFLETGSALSISSSHPTYGATPVLCHSPFLKFFRFPRAPLSLSAPVFSNAVSQLNVLRAPVFGIPNVGA